MACYDIVAKLVDEAGAPVALRRVEFGFETEDGAPFILTTGSQFQLTISDDDGYVRGCLVTEWVGWCPPEQPRVPELPPIGRVVMRLFPAEAGCSTGVNVTAGMLGPEQAPNTGPVTRTVNVGTVTIACPALANTTGK